LQDFSTRQAGKRPAQTVSNGCEYGFFVKRRAKACKRMGRAYCPRYPKQSCLQQLPRGCFAAGLKRNRVALFNCFDS